MRGLNPDFEGEAAFSDAGETVPSIGFDYAAVDGVKDSGDDGARSEREITVRLLQWLNGGNASRLEIGTRSLVLQYWFNPEGTQRQLAKRMRIPESKVSERLAELRRKLGDGKSLN